MQIWLGFVVHEAQYICQVGRACQEVFGVCVYLIETILWSCIHLGLPFDLDLRHSNYLENIAA